ncbi:auxin-responsive protein SAUR24-like [Vigna unguiculata]|uniref:auxin-responsive protein SAUR24-like n=1 Tax=Vigna unguiculata TaxID=3917 RepID=UPI001015D6CD|nr:auxin-responsive protein SAUR24-like [Vigna unguiculata]
MKLSRSFSICAPKIIKKIPNHIKKSSFSRSLSCHIQHHSKKPLLGSGETSDGAAARNAKVPKGFIAVYVGPDFRRFIIPVRFLAMPDFTALMESVAEEYGCDHHGAIHIPCDEDYFEQILTSCSHRKRALLPPKKLSDIPIISSH